MSGGSMRGLELQLGAGWPHSGELGEAIGLVADETLAPDSSPRGPLDTIERLRSLSTFVHDCVRGLGGKRGAVWLEYFEEIERPAPDLSAQAALYAALQAGSATYWGTDDQSVQALIEQLRPRRDSTAFVDLMGLLRAINHASHARRRQR